MVAMISDIGPLYYYNAAKPVRQWACIQVSLDALEGLEDEDVLDVPQTSMMTPEARAFEDRLSRGAPCLNS